MKRFLFFLCLGRCGFFFLVLLWPAVGYGQKSLHNTHWLIGNSSIPVDFSTLPPQYGGIPPSQNNEYALNNTEIRHCIAVSDEFGELQFFVQYRYNSFSSNNDIYFAPKVFDRNGNAFSNDDLFIKFNTNSDGVPIVVPYPHQNHKYILFHSTGNGLFYSVVDMTLNNGLGDIDPTQKEIMVGNPGTVLGFKMITVPACEDKVWLVVRSLSENAYYSYLIDENGVNPNQIVSPIGNFEMEVYRTFVGGYSNGFLTASHNGKYIIAATAGGTEIYDFEKCSGKLKNARVLDTVFSHGVIFSPDDSKLYINTFNGIYFAVGGGAHRQVGEIYQFDFNQPSFDDIKSTKTIVMRNPIYEKITVFGPQQYSGGFGQMKIGIDGKLYVSKNNPITHTSSDPCYLLSPFNQQAIPTPPNNDCHYGQYLHVIHQPNELGMNCQPEFDYVHLNDFYDYPPGVWLQQDIKPANFQPIDTLAGTPQNIIVCFEDKTTLYASESLSCPIWDDGSSALEKTITQSGTYWLGSSNDCSYLVDTFHVELIPLPQVNAQHFGCPGNINVHIRASDSVEFQYQLINEEEEMVAEFSGKGDAQLNGLEEGAYSLQITAKGLCDTVLPIVLKNMPVPEVTSSPEKAMIMYGDSIQIFASGAERYLWSPSGPLDDAHATSPWARPWEPTVFTVLGFNEYGCYDSSYVFLDIDYNLPDLLPNAFSPNGDGLNDVFKIQGVTYQKIIVFNVFNRLGQLVFSSTNPEMGWDGTHNGKACDPGVYYYMIKLSYPDGRMKEFKGDVSLIR